MFGLGFCEIIGILVVALILVNPRELPKLVRKIGAAYGKMTHHYRSMIRMIREAESEMKYSTDEKVEDEIKLPFTRNSDSTDRKHKKPLR